jgi:hypothetical protein
MRSVAGDLSEAQSDWRERSANERMYKRKKGLQVTLTHERLSELRMKQIPTRISSSQVRQEGQIDDSLANLLVDR